MTAMLAEMREKLRLNVEEGDQLRDRLHEAERERKLHTTKVAELRVALRSVVEAYSTERAVTATAAAETRAALAAVLQQLRAEEENIASVVIEVDNDRGSVNENEFGSARVGCSSAEASERVVELRVTGERLLAALDKDSEAQAVTQLLTEDVARQLELQLAELARHVAAAREKRSSDREKKNRVTEAAAERTAQKVREARHALVAERSYKLSQARHAMKIVGKDRLLDLLEEQINVVEGLHSDIAVRDKELKEKTDIEGQLRAAHERTRSLETALEAREAEVREVQMELLCGRVAFKAESEAARAKLASLRGKAELTHKYHRLVSAEAAKLRARLDKAGIGEGEPVSKYCQTDHLELAVQRLNHRANGEPVARGWARGALAAAQIGGFQLVPLPRLKPLLQDMQRGMLVAEAAARSRRTDPPSLQEVAYRTLATKEGHGHPVPEAALADFAGSVAHHSLLDTEVAAFGLDCDVLQTAT
eukprot:960542-Prorocentrum_minimum.AAC.1